jgi:glycosyltransferase involved in cell wall biosynthesis
VAELGIGVDLLTYGEGQDVEISGVRIIRIPKFASLGPAKAGPSILKLFLDGFMALWALGLLLCHRYGFVHAHEEAVFFCRFLKPVFGFKLVYDMHSSLPQQLKNFKYTDSKLLLSLFEKLEKSCLRVADVIVTICPDLSDHVSRLLPRDKKHLLIENSIFEPIKLVSGSSRSNRSGSSDAIQKTLAELPGGKRFIVYTGTLEHYQGVEILIDAFSRVVAQNRDAFLVIVGGTDTQVERYSALANARGLGRSCLFTGSVSPSLARQYGRLASVLVSPRIKGTNTPLKIYQYLASGTPLVATRIRAHTQVLDDTIAVLVEPEPEDLARGILGVLNSDGAAQKTALRASRFYEQNYSRSVYQGKMKRLVEFLS